MLGCLARPSVMRVGPTVGIMRATTSGTYQDRWSREIPSRMVVMTLRPILIPRNKSGDRRFLRCVALVMVTHDPTPPDTRTGCCSWPTVTSSTR